MKRGKKNFIAVFLSLCIVVSTFVEMASLPVMAHEYVGGDIRANWVDSWMEEQPEFPAIPDKKIQFNYDNAGTDAYHLGDVNVAVWITLYNSDHTDDIYVGNASLETNHALFTPNQDTDDDHTIWTLSTCTFKFTIDIGTSGQINTLYTDALRLRLENLEQPYGTPIGDETLDFDIYVSSVFDDDSPDNDMDKHDDLPDIEDTDADMDTQFEAGVDMQEGEIQLTEYADYDITDVEGTLSNLASGIALSGGVDTAFNLTGGGTFSLFWNFDVEPSAAPGYYTGTLELVYNRSDIGARIIEYDRPTGLYVAPSTTVTGPIGGPTNVVGIAITYNMTGSPPSVDLYYTTNISAPYSWIFIDTDSSAEGTYEWIIPYDGSYGWFAVSENETVPNSSDAPEAAYYVYDGTPPEMESTDPMHTSTDVAIDQDLVLTFNETMNTTSISYTIEPDPGGLSEVWGDGNTSLTIFHTDFLKSTRYWVNITAGTDLASNNLNPLPYSFYFDTAASATSNATGPQGGPTNIADITIKYNTTGSPANINLYYTTDNLSPYTWTLLGTDSPADGSYDWIIPSDGSYGWYAVSPDESAPLSTDAPETSFYIFDSTSPEILSTSPVNMSAEVPVNQDVIIMFNEVMIPGSVSYTVEPNPEEISEVWNANNTTITISHTNFTTATRYWVNITTVTDLAENNLNPLPYSFYFDTVTLDITPPLVIESTPSGSSVAITSNITISFSEGMDTASVESAFSFTDDTTTWDITNGVVIWNANNDTMTFDPSFDLNYGVKYTVNISSIAQDVASNYLTTYTWSFTVTQEPDTTEPFIVSVLPAKKVIKVTDTISIEFSEPMNHPLVENAISISPNASIAGFIWEGNKLTIKFVSDLKTDTEYTVTIDTGAEDKAGNTLSEPYIWTFTTEGEPGEEVPILWLLLGLIIIILVSLLLWMMRRRKQDEMPEEDTVEENEEEEVKFQ